MDASRRIICAWVVSALWLLLMLLYMAQVFAQNLIGLCFFYYCCRQQRKDVHKSCIWCTNLKCSFFCAREQLRIFMTSAHHRTKFDNILYAIVRSISVGDFSIDKSENLLLSFYLLYKSIQRTFKPKWICDIVKLYFQRCDMLLVFFCCIFSFAALKYLHIYYNICLFILNFLGNGIWIYKSFWNVYSQLPNGFRI